MGLLTALLAVAIASVQTSAVAQNPPRNPVNRIIQQLFGGGGPAAPPAAPDEEDAESTNPDRDHLDGRAFHDPALTRRLRQAAQLVENGKWSDACELYQSLLDYPGDALTQAEGGEWTSLKEEAERTIAQLPPAGRQAYETLYGASARLAIQEALEKGNLGDLGQQIDRYFHTAAGRDAAERLADSLLDRGDFATAAVWYERLGVVDQPADHPPARVAAAAIAHVATGDDESARKLAESLLASRELSEQLFGTVPETVDEWIAAATAAIGPVRTPLLHDWPLPLGTATHTGIAAGDEPLLIPRWSMPLTNRYHVSSQVENLMLDLHDSGRATIPVFATLSIEGKLAIRTYRGIAVIDVESGELIWEYSFRFNAEQLLTGEVEDSRSGTASRRPQVNVRFTGGGHDQHPLTSFLFRNTATGWLSSDRERLFVIEDAAVLGTQNYNYFWNRSEAQDPLGRDVSSNRLVAYDLESGRRLWQVGGTAMGETFDLPHAGTYFLGPPVIEGDDLFAIGEQDHEIRLFVLNPQTGEPRWSQPLALTGAGIEQDTVRRFWGAPPAVTDGMIICPTTVGWLVAIDRQTRRLRWAHRYTPRNANNRRRMRGFATQSLQSLNTRWSPTAPLVSGHHVLFAPPELPDEFGNLRPQLICFDLRTGEKAWHLEKEDLLYPAGVFEDQVLIVGQRQVQSASLSQRGRMKWTTELPGRLRPSGRAIIVQDRLYVPMQDGVLVTLNAKTGEILDEERCTNGELGSLLAHRGYLLSTTPIALTCFEERSAVLAEIERRQESDPEDLWAAVQLAQIDIIGGDHLAAIAHLEQVPPPAAEQNDELARTFRQLRFRSLTEVVAGEPTGRDAEFERLQQAAGSPEEQFEVRRLALARSLAREDYSAAATILWELTGTDMPETVEVDSCTMRSDVWLAGRFLDLWNAAPEEVRSALDQKIREKIAAAADQGVEVQQQIERRFGFHDAVVTLQEQMVESFLSAGDVAAAELRLWRVIRRGSDKQRLLARIRMAELLAEAGHHQDAAWWLTGTRAELDALEAPEREDISRQMEAAAEAAGLTLPWQTGPVGPRWSDYEFEMVRGNGHHNRSPVHGVDIEAAPEPFYATHRFSFNQNLQRLSAIRIADEQPYWSVPLRNGAHHLHSQSVGLIPVGYQLFALHRGTLHALSLLDREVAWTSSMSMRGGSEYARHPDNERTDALTTARQFAARQGLTTFRAPTGMMALANSRYIVCHGRGEFIVFDSGTGDRLWSLGDIPPRTMVHGTDELIFVVPARAEDAFAVRALDGQRVKIENLTELIPQAVAVHDEAIIRVASDSATYGAKLQIRATRIDDGTELWSHPLNGSAFVSLIDGRSLLVLNPDGNCQMIEFDTGDARPFGPLPAKLFKELHRSYVLADRNHIYVILERPTNQYSYISTPSIHVNGHVIALDRNSGQVIWKQEVENQNLLMSHFDAMPILLFTAVTHRQQRNVVFQEMRLLAVDKPTGRVLMDWTRPISNGGLNQVELNLRDRFVELRSYSERLRLQAETPATTAEE
ncbi:outer membrane biogenesis protein BamB [Maioricimonas rarisocia]|uniref:Outer membrane biogenesis protein BamB n=2 Tax=Maioricimonas rarisocia TaxID=2528026 RepID=A0A517Z288_9PLAN|nr:outer membrane biogenesis protein BamB [Maioricimonas rarisocia]